MSSVISFTELWLTVVLPGNYSDHFLGGDEASADFPSHLRPYSNTGRPGTICGRVFDASEYSNTIVGVLIRHLCTTPGILGIAFDNFTNLLRTCQGCANHFTPDGFNAHLLPKGDGTYYCGNHPNRAAGQFRLASPKSGLSFTDDLTLPPVSPVDITVYKDDLPQRQFPLGCVPGEHGGIKFIEFGSVTAVGIALIALNTKMGLPDDIWQGIRSAIVSCADCGHMRSIHAHNAHLVNGVCQDVPESCLIALSANEVAAIGADGRRSVIAITEN